MEPGAASPPGPRTRGSGWAVWGLVLAILGLCAFPIAIVGVVLAVVGLIKMGKDGSASKTVAIVAICVGGLAVPVNGILAALAIPGFVAYIRRAKTAEATDSLAFLTRAVAGHYAEERPGAPRELPPSVARTPGQPPCGTKAPWPADADPGWRALGFAPEVPVHFAYEYERSADGRSFAVRAFGDLDCDGKLSTYERSGVVENAEIRLSAGLWTRNEFE